MVGTGRGREAGAGNEEAIGTGSDRPGSLEMPKGFIIKDLKDAASSIDATEGVLFLSENQEPNSFSEAAKRSSSYTSASGMAESWRMA